MLFHHCLCREVSTEPSLGSACHQLPYAPGQTDRADRRRDTAADRRGGGDPVSDRQRASIHPVIGWWYGTVAQAPT